MDILTAVAANGLRLWAGERRARRAGETPECRKMGVAGRFRIELPEPPVSYGSQGAADDDTHRFPARDHRS